MHRSEITIDLGAVRRNARRLLDVLEGVGAVGGRQGGRLRPRRRRRRRRGARRGRDCPLRRDGGRGAGAPRRVFRRCASSSWARRRAGRSRWRGRPTSSSPCGTLPVPEGVRGPPEARHRHGAVGALGAAGADDGRRRADDPPRHRRQRSGLRARADRALRRGDEGPPAPDPPRRQQRRGSSASRSRASTPPGAGSRCTGSRRSAATPPTTGSSRRSAGRAGWRRSSGCAPGRARATAAGSSRTRTPGSASCRSATRTGSVAT